MEIRQLKTFRMVANLLSFNRAAEALHYAQSSISAQIHALEDDLGVRLFDRLGRTILLTEAGERLLRYADKILALEEETRAELADGTKPSGHLTIRVPESLCVHRFPGVIRRFRARYPRVRLKLTTCAHEGLQKDLRKGITDLAFLFAESVHASDLDVDALGVEPIILVTSPDHPLARKNRLRSVDLESETVLLSTVDCSYRKSFERLLQEAGVAPENRLVFHSVAALKACVAAGVGVTVLPAMTVREELAAGRLVSLKWEEKEIEMGVLMLWYKERWRSPALTAFMETARDVLVKDIEGEEAL